MNMKRVLALVEGSTEEAFIKYVMNPKLSRNYIWITPIIITIKRIEKATDFKGGSPHYDKFKKEIKRLLNDSKAVRITTMFDYYGLSKSFPGRDNPLGKTALDKVRYVERAMAEDINHDKYLPYLSLHEFEALLFSDPKTIAQSLLKPETESEFQSIKNSFSSPEKINDNPDLAPSKRLKNIFPEYNKIRHGRLISKKIGLKKLRSECSHFDDWLTHLENIAR